MNKPTLNEIKVNGVLYDIEDSEARENIADILKYKTMTKEQMLNVVDDEMPDTCSTFCSDDNNFYIYNKTNEPDEETGKFTLYQNLTIDTLSDTPYVFIKPTTVILSLPVADWLLQSYSLDNICSNKTDRVTPSIIFKNDHSETTFKTQITMAIGDSLDVYAGKITENNYFTKLTSTSSITTFGEANANNIRMILCKISTSSAYTPDLSNPENFKFCSHLPYLTDYVDDTSVSQEGYRLETSSTTVFVYMYINADREYCASKDAFGKQLSTWNSNKTPFTIGYLKQRRGTSSASVYTPPAQIYLNGNYTITTDMPELAEVTITASSLIALNDILYDVNRSINTLNKDVTSLRDNIVSTNAGIISDATIVGKLSVGEEIVHRRSVLDANSRLGTYLFELIIGDDTNTIDMIMSEIKDIFNRVIQVISPDSSSLFVNRSDAYYANILKLEIPISYDGHDPETGRIFHYNPIVTIERIPSFGALPDSDNDPSFRDVTIVHKYTMMWDDHTTGGYNLLNFNIISEYNNDSGSSWENARLFTFTPEGSIEKISRNKSSGGSGGGNGILTLNYNVPEELLNTYDALWSYDATNSLYELMSNYMDANFEQNVLSTSGLSDFQELIQKFSQININFIFENKMDLGMPDEFGNPLYDINTTKLCMNFTKFDESSFSGGDPFMPTNNIFARYYACLPTLSGLHKIEFEIGCDINYDGTKYNSHRNVDIKYCAMTV